MQKWLIGVPAQSKTPEPTPSGTVTPTTDLPESAEYIVSDVFSATWWLTTLLPVAIQVVTIVVVGLIVRWLVFRAINRTVAKMTAIRRRKIDSVWSEDVERQIGGNRDIQRAETMGKFLHNITTIVVFTFVVLLILAQLGVELGPLIAGAGIVGVALGFGAQSLVADFMNGIFMLMEDQYGVGDVVEIGEATGAVGTVERVSLRVTEVRAIDGTLWTVRNGQINYLGNMSQGWSRGVLDIRIAYGTDIEKAREVLLGVGRAFAESSDFGPKVLERPEVWGVQELGPDSMVLRLVVKTRPGDHWAVSRALLEQIKNALDKNGIEIPFPQRTLWFQDRETAKGENPLSDT
jgi:small-conductance mechanosensitive channel